MHIFISGIGGFGMSSLAMIALDAGINVSGSDKTANSITAKLECRTESINYTQDGSFLRERHKAMPIDWFIYTSALPDDSEELVVARELGIKISKRDEFLNYFFNTFGFQLICVSGTHGKTTTTGMLIFVLLQLGIPISYSVGGELLFGKNGKYEKGSKYFVYEADEYDRNFLAFHPDISLITSIGYDHTTIYPTRESYVEAFKQFIEKSEKVFILDTDAKKINTSKKLYCATTPNKEITLPGEHNKRNAHLVLMAIKDLFPEIENKKIIEYLNTYKGIARRYEHIRDNLYSDYAHHPTELISTINRALEDSDDVVIVYQPHDEIRQYSFLKEYRGIFKKVKNIYLLPIYSPRTKEVKMLPEDIISTLTIQEQKKTKATTFDELKEIIERHIYKGDLVVCMTAGTLDRWLRKHFGSIK